MDRNDNIISSLSWGVGLYTPIDLGSLFNSRDLVKSGLELDSKIDIVHCADFLPKDSILDDISLILGGEKYQDFLDLCKNERFSNILNIFELRKQRHNGYESIVLKLKSNNEFFGIIRLLNKGFQVKYNLLEEIDDDFSPVITLAEIKTGSGDKYLESSALSQVLNESKVDFEDIILSVLTGDEWKQHFITTFKNVDRYFRLSELKKSNDELNKLLEEE